MDDRQSDAVEEQLRVPVVLTPQYAASFRDKFREQFEPNSLAEHVVVNEMARRASRLEFLDQYSGKRSEDSWILTRMLPAGVLSTNLSRVPSRPVGYRNVIGKAWETHEDSSEHSIRWSSCGKIVKPTPSIKCPISIRSSRMKWTARVTWFPDFTAA